MKTLFDRLAVRARRHERVGVVRADNRHGVHGVGVARVDPVGGVRSFVDV